MKRIYAFLVALAMVFTLVAWSGGSTASASTKTEQNASQVAAQTRYSMIPLLRKYKQYRYKGHMNVLYLVCTTAAEYFPDSYAVWKPMMKRVGIHIDLMGPPEFTDSALISMLETELASRKYDLVVLYPVTPAAITPLLGNLWKTYHVPILAYGFPPSSHCGDYYLGTSYYACGLVEGRAIVNYVNRNADYFDKLKTIPVVVYKQAQAVDQYARIRGALDVLKKDGRFTLIGQYEANLEAACLTQTETVLTNHPETQIIIGQIDNDVTGAYQAVASGTYKHSSHLSLWGFDATGAVLNLMAKGGPNGYVQGSTFIDHHQSGEALCELIPILVGAAKQGKLIKFDKADTEWLGTALSHYYVTVTPENIKKYYRKYNKK